jgi:hypothetical protein
MSGDEDSVDEELAQLREQTDPGTRVDDGDDTSGAALEDAIVSALRDIDAGETAKTLSLRDERLAALARGLEETGELAEVGAALQEELGRDTAPGDIDRSELLRLALILGLEQAASDVTETARGAYGRYAAEGF